ncbi:MAG: YtxH domain-containing protein [Gemmatimonadales bacterium]|nr:MAG: YtxH domain-containing protein [Gemmatimonadales bacterium]
MEYDDDARLFNFLSGLICGAAIGAGVALLMAPDSGKKTRKRIHRAADDLRDTATDRWEDISEEVRDKVDEALSTARKRFS